MSNKWLTIGDIRESKAGKLYIKIDEKFEGTLKGGDALTLIKHKENILGLVDKGFITQEEADERIEKTNFIKYKIFKAPNNGKK